MTKSELKFEKFDGSGDFSLWKRRMFAHLRLLGLKDVLVEQAPLPALTAEEEGDPATKKKRIADEAKRLELSDQAMDTICLNVGDKVLRKIEKSTTAAEMWSLLERLYMVKTLPNRVYLQLKVYTFKMQEKKTIEENINDFLKMIADLSNLKIEVPDEVQAVLLLSSLPAKYDMLRETLKYGREGITFEEVASAAKSKELDLKDASGSKSAAEGLFVSSRGRQSQKSNNQWRGRSKSKARSQSRPKHNNSKGCWICGKDGHWKRDCPERKNKNPETNVVEPVNVAASSAEPLVLTASVQDPKDEWVLDSGCTFHITPNKDLLFDLEEFEGGRVLMANNTHSDVKGMGKIKIVNPDGTQVILTEVRYMPTVGRNLISYGLLEKSGCRYEGKGFRVQFYKGDRKVISGKYLDGLYYLEGTVTKNEVSLATSDKDKTTTWHSRLGYTPSVFDKLSF